MTPPVYFILCVLWIAAAAENLQPCYDSEGNALKCDPAFMNIAFGSSIEATNTCSGRAMNNATREDNSTDELYNFHTYSVHTSSSGEMSTCDLRSSDSSKHHPAANMVDTDTQGTWWQSVTLYEYRERNLGDMLKSSITLDFGKSYEMSYLKLTFHSSRPESFAIFKKTTKTSNWEPYQYFSSSCQYTYNLTQDGVIEGVKSVICTNRYSDISPLTGGTVMFSVPEGRIDSLNSVPNPELQELMTLTALKIELTRLNTFGNEVTGQKSVLQSYYYALSDITVGARCKCNGHANQCIESDTEMGREKLVCQCQHNTSGEDCGKCPRTHNDRPWAPATNTDANPCRECNCADGSSFCDFNPELYMSTNSTSGSYCETNSATSGSANWTLGVASTLLLFIYRLYCV